MDTNLGNKKIMARNIKHYMEINNLSRKEVCQAIGVKYTTFTDWINGNVYPRIDKIELMANYFGVSKSDLVEDTDKLVVTEEEYNYVSKIREMDIKSKELIMTVIDMEYKRNFESDSKKRLAEYSKRISEVNYEREHNTEEE